MHEIQYRVVSGKEVYTQPLPISMNVAIAQPSDSGIYRPVIQQGQTEPELPTEMVVDFVRGYKYSKELQ